MKPFLLIFLLLFSGRASSTEPDTFVGYLSSSRMSNYTPKTDCDAKKYDCNEPSFYAFYVNTLKVVSSIKAPRKISVTMESHSSKFRKSNKLWIVKIKHLDPIVAKGTGAKYELVGAAEINGDYCTHESLLPITWLYPIDMEIEEYQDDRDWFCYKSISH